MHNPFALDSQTQYALDVLGAEPLAGSGLPLTFRAAGTSLSGQSNSDGILAVQEQGAALRATLVRGRAANGRDGGDR